MNCIDNLGGVIKNARVKKGISQEQLAEMLGVTPTHVKHMESGRRKPSVEILFAISDKLNMSLDSLLVDECNSKQKIVEEISFKLESCDEKELKIISDIINAFLNSHLY